MKMFLFLIFGLSILTLNAQILNQVGSSIKNGATTKAADFNRSRSNKEKNDLDKNAAPKSSETETEQNSEESAPAPENGELTPLDYIFTHILSYETISYSGSEESGRNTLSYYFGDSVTLFSTEESFLLNDIRNKKTLIIDENSKTGYSSTYMEPVGNEINELNRQIYPYRKTGNTKQILGYTCEEYVLEYEGKKLSTIWSSLENPLKKDNLDPKYLTDQTMMGVNSLNPNPNGLVMEFNQYDPEEVLINTIRVSNYGITDKKLQGEFQITSY